MPLVDQGALGGIAQALSQGVDSYLSVQEKQKQRDREALVQKTELEAKGYTKDEITGRLVRTPEFLAEEKRKLDNQATVTAAEHAYQMKRDEEKSALDFNRQKELKQVEYANAQGLKSQEGRQAMDRELVQQGQAYMDPKTGKLAYGQPKGLIGVKQVEQIAKQQKAAFDALPEDSKKQIEFLAQKKANVSLAKSGLSQLVKQLEDPNIPEAEKRDAAAQSAKLLNSTEGADAIGAEEASRLLSLLQYQKFNMTNARAPMFGYAPISEFTNDLKNNVSRLEGRHADLDGEISKLYAPVSGLRPELPSQMASATAQAPQQKVVGNVTYKKVPGGWEEVAAETSSPRIKGAGGGLLNKANAGGR